MEEKQKLIKESVNLPQTDFPMRAGLINREPEILSFWKQNTIYEKILDTNAKSSKSYLLHDGPPYPNGDIHMGHALNKVLKDIVVRSKSMQGYKSIFIPGWDCHGLPIETQVLKSLKKQGLENKKTDIKWFRNKCKEFALDYVNPQREEFIRLGIFGEWQNPYLTLNKQYESKVIELFGQIADNGLVFRGRKPIHWCASCETALAEAEIEYNEKRSPSIYMKFEVDTPSTKLKSIIQEQNASVLVWTTTPWTLPANVAIAAHADFTYLVAKANDNIFIFVKELQDKLTEVLEFTGLELLGELSGKDLKDTETKHPFIDRTSKIVNANYVTKEDGTGFVHIAPGHGVDDYIVGQEHGLPIIMPVDDKGKFTGETPWEGTPVFEANKLICETMEQKKTLLKLFFIKHSYPHCWRCKKPLIFRATEQWFIAMDKKLENDKNTLREMALNEIKKTTWYPSWGETRISSMIENRPDWCISRQRFWGIPIPVFICKNCNNAEMTGEFNKAIVELVEQEGTMAWFAKEASEILPKNLKCSSCGSNEFLKESDILDVWFESGASFKAVLETNDNLSIPADLYLEGSDQHRGWFQSSLLLGLGGINQPPFKAVLTHGFIVDEKGKKMSKSLGNVISPLKVIKESGADILRWWISLSDFKNDISISQNVLKQARDSFAKVRNTIRFCLSNLHDFDIEKDNIIYENLNEIDQWALLKLNDLVKKSSTAYNNFDFHIIAHSVHDFCAVTLSALYLDMVKDRLYCDSKNSFSRKSTQNTLYSIVDTLLCLLAPILVFTTEDAYSFFNKANKEASIHLEKIPENKAVWDNIKIEQRWQELLSIKDQCYQKLEKLRQDKIIGSFLEAEVILTLTQEMDFKNWESLLIVSNVIIKQGNELKIEVYKAEHEKCIRCWKRLPLKDDLCTRCHDIFYATK
jgi:isoleucyl-tRNA synthetase